MNTNKLDESIVDKAFEAAGGHADTSPMTWARTKAALDAVYCDMTKSAKRVDLDVANTQVDRLRRLIDACPDDRTREDMRAVLGDLAESLGG